MRLILGLILFQAMGERAIRVDDALHSLEINLCVYWDWMRLTNAFNRIKIVRHLRPFNKLLRSRSSGLFFEHRTNCISLHLIAFCVHTGAYGARCCVPEFMLYDGIMWGRCHAIYLVIGQLTEIIGENFEPITIEMPRLKSTEKKTIPLNECLMVGLSKSFYLIHESQSFQRSQISENCDYDRDEVSPFHNGHWWRISLLNERKKSTGDSIGQTNREKWPKT